MLTENQLFANRYRLVKRLGQGAFSEVWKAEDTKVGNLTVALKVYAPDKGLDEDGSKVFGDEFAIVFNLHHQNLLTPSTFDEENGSPYLVLPFCERGSSLKLVGRMDERQVAKFLCDVSSALAYLHAKDIIHQDIKPDNVLIDGDNNFMVTDFGISTRIRSTLRRSVGDKKSAGTTAYMGPERFSKNPDPIKASDMWSLGATVFELMKGDVPFGEGGGLVQKMGAEIPNIHGQYSPELKGLVAKCLSAETWDRPTAAQLRDICDHYLRTGAWDLSVLGKSAASEPDRLEKTQEPVGRPTVRKLNAVKEPEPPRVETPTRQDPEKPKAGEEENSGRRKWIPWVIGGTVVIVVTLAILLIVFLTQGPKVVTEKWVGETVDEEPTALISDPETEALAKTYTVNDVSFTMIYVEGGTFTMGCTSEQGSDCYSHEKPSHQVTLSDFCIGETEVTQALWKAVMGSEPSYNGWWTNEYGRGDSYPAYRVSWDDCQEFILKLNALTGKTFRLPTEAEWEYAARGGNKSKGYKYAGGNVIGDVAWYDDNGSSTTHPVKGKQPNELGLYDMSGNVWEWCQDWKGDYSSSSQTNPTGPSSGSYRVRRGGSWNYDAGYCRVFYRGYEYPVNHLEYLGFRLSLVR
ncbi:MAG: SUMF1/EgtB/PvdO family nonheme iron enzyme [Bacteroidales bacterium]|nr:SUMF1/EgtB/PvdO family nonheme iron enzyme [Bacteroidales bacterium]